MGHCTPVRIIWFPLRGYTYQLSSSGCFEDSNMIPGFGRELTSTSRSFAMIDAMYKMTSFSPNSQPGRSCDVPSWHPQPQALLLSSKTSFTVRKKAHPDHCSPFLLPYHLFNIFSSYQGTFPYL